MSLPPNHSPTVRVTVHAVDRAWDRLGLPIDIDATRDYLTNEYNATRVRYPSPRGGYYHVCPHCVLVVAEDTDGTPTITTVLSLRDRRARQLSE